MVGSEGTLGVITSARLRLSPAPQLRVFRGFEVAERRRRHRGDPPGAAARAAPGGGAALRRARHLPQQLASRAATPAAESVEHGHAYAPTPLPGEGACRCCPGPRPRRRRRAAAPAAGAGPPRLARPAPRRHRRRCCRGRALVNGLVGAVAEKIARKGCQMIIGLEGARIRTEIEAALDLRRARARRRQRPGRGAGPGLAGPPLRRQLPHVAGVPRRRLRRHHGGGVELGAAARPLPLGARGASAATPW